LAVRRTGTERLEPKRGTAQGRAGEVEIGLVERVEKLQAENPDQGSLIGGSPKRSLS
jgi:hypothetical protein